jgi:hypothetical protein
MNLYREEAVCHELIAEKLYIGLKGNQGTSEGNGCNLIALLDKNNLRE